MTVDGNIFFLNTIAERIQRESANRQIQIHNIEIEGIIITNTIRTTEQSVIKLLCGGGSAAQSNSHQNTIAHNQIRRVPN